MELANLPKLGGFSGFRCQCKVSCPLFTCHIYIYMCISILGQSWIHETPQDDLGSLAGLGMCCAILAVRLSAVLLRT